MITLIVKNKNNIIINEETGKFITFKYDKEDIVYKNIKVNKLKQIYPNFNEFYELLKQVKNDNIKFIEEPDEINYLILHTSDACNMKCAYCYAVDNIIDNECNKMDYKVMIASIKKFYNNKNFFVLFHGREPLTNYYNIKKTIEYFKDKKNIHFILQTNGMLLDAEKMNYFKNNKIAVNISIDGIDDYSNSLRINNMKDIDFTKKTKYLIEKYKLSPIIILHKKNYQNIMEILNYLIKSDVNNVSINLLWPTKDNEKLINELIDISDLINTMKKVINLMFSSSSFIIKEREIYLLYGRILKRHFNNYMCNCAPCGAGKKCLSVYKNGEIFPCTMFNNQDNNYMGTIDDDITDIMKREVLIKQRNIKNIKDCNECPLRLFCKGGGCSGFITNYTNNINAKSMYCEYYYEIIIYLISKIADISGQKYFMNF